MPKYLNNIDLDGNQLLSPVIHVSSQSTTTNGPAGDSTGTEGQIFYNSHSGAKALYFRDDSGWRPIGDISGVTAGAGLSGGGAGGTVSLAIDISEFSDVTPVNGDKLLTLDSDGSTEQLTTVASLATLFAGSGLTATNSVIAVDTLNQNTTGQAGSVANALTVDNATVKLNTGTTYNGSSALTLSAKTATIANGGTALATADQIHTFVTGLGYLTSQTSHADVLVDGDFTSNGLMKRTSAGVYSIDSNTYSTATGVENNADVTDGTNVAAAGAVMDGDFTSNGFMKRTGAGSYTVDTNSYITGYTVTTADVKSALNASFSGTGTIGDSSDTFTIPGNFVVDGSITLKGATVLESTENTAIKDKILVLNEGATGTPSNDLAVMWQRGNQPNCAIKWNETDNQFELIVTTAAGNEANGAINVVAVGELGQAAGVRGYQHLRLSKAIVEAIALDGNTITGINNSSEFTDDDTHIMTSAAINDRFAVINANTTGSSGSVSSSLTVDNTTIKLNSGTTFNGASARTISAKTASIADGGAALATADQIHTFVTGFGYTTNTGTTTAGNTQTFSSKSIDADNNTISNIEVDNFKGSAIVTESEAIGSNDNDTTIPTSAAVKDYVDNATSSSGNTGGRQAFSLANAGSVVATNSGKTFTITHGMGASLNYGVEVIRAANGSGETVYTDVTRTTTTIVINFAVAPTSADYTALVCKY